MDDIDFYVQGNVAESLPALLGLRSTFTYGVAHNRLLEGNYP